jgi:hypothetical protein
MSPTAQPPYPPTGEPRRRENVEEAAALGGGEVASPVPQPPPPPPLVTSRRTSLETAAAVCSLGIPSGCKWHFSGPEWETEEAANVHARACPGHIVTVQVQTRETWLVALPDPRAQP